MVGRSDSADSIGRRGSPIRSLGGCSQFLIDDAAGKEPSAAVAVADVSATPDTVELSNDAAGEATSNQPNQQWMRAEIAAAIRNIHNAKKATIRQHYYPEGIF